MCPWVSNDSLWVSFSIVSFSSLSAWLRSAVDKTPNEAVTGNSCRLEMVSLRAQIPATWCNYPLWNSGVRGQLSLPVFVTFQSSVSWWQLCYPSILSLPPPPPLLELRRKPSAELAFRRFFFFFKYQFPFVPKQPPIRASVCWVCRKAGTGFPAPRGKVAHLLFFLIRFPAILQDSQRVQLLLSAVGWEPPCSRSLHGEALAGGKNTPPKKKRENRTQKQTRGDKMEPTPK